jgi:arsenite methyltransferase
MARPDVVRPSLVQRHWVHRLWVHRLWVHRVFGGVSLALAAATLAACDRGTTSPDAGATTLGAPESSPENLEDPARDAWAKPDEVVAALPVASPAAQVADIGSGTGYFTRRIAARVPEGKVIAVDVDRKLAKYVRDHRDAWGTPNIEPRLALYENPALPEDSMDLVFMSNTYHLIDDRPAYLGVIAKALHSGGHLVVIDFKPDCACTDVKEPPEVTSRVARETAIAEAQAAGFEVEREETFLPNQWFLVLRKK